jgi:hypothetical protein
MYQGALIMFLSTLFWNHIMSVLLGLVYPQGWIPYVQMGFRICLYRIFSNLICTLFTVLEGQNVGCVLDSRSRAGFWKNDTAAVHAVRTIQYNTIIILFITVGARGGRSINATTNGPRKCLGMTPVDSYG